MGAGPREDGFAAALARSIACAARDDTAAFSPALLAWLRLHAAFDHCVIFGYRGAQRPVSLFETFEPQESGIYVAQYQAGPYLLDPFYLAAIDRVEGFRRMRELAPDRFYTSEYFRSYYETTGLAEEVGYFATLRDGTAIVMSLMRLLRSGTFGTAEVRRLRALTPVLLALINLHWPGLPKGTGRNTGGAQGRQLERDRVKDNMGLTMREVQIVEHVLQGHSSESIARLLGVAAGTVKVHRRNIYKKLGIGSQAELFAGFLRSVGGES